ncbi:MAG: PA14 domain-containing protein, partial [Chloroflexi bacterium]|nr:PA14 domain-containing protein [Chloroflexota bacterium]
YTYAVEKPQAEARQGLLGRYYPNPGGPPGSSAQALPRQAIALHQGGAWPLSSLSAAEWEGGLYAPQYGAYRFSLAGRGAADLEIDGRKVVELAPGQAGAEGTATLYQGMHSLSARYRAGDGPPTLELKWAPPGKGFEPVPMEYLTPVGPRQDQGLTATYFEGADWQGSPLFQRVDGSVDFWWPREEPIPDRSFSVEWSGWLEVQRAGDYRFDVFSHDGAWLYVDDRLVVDNGGQHPEQWRGGQANLQPGQRRIRVRYFQVRTAANIGPKGIRLYWTPPGSPRQVIPSDALRPLDTK